MILAKLWWLAVLFDIVARSAAPPGVVIDHESPKSQRYIGSPSIAVLGNGNYVATHDFFGPNSGFDESGITRVFLSKDRGETWRRAAELKEQFWSDLFLNRDKLYLMGTSRRFGRMVIRESRDGGVTWSAPNYLSDDSGYHTAPVPVVVARGRIWRAMEYHPEGPWGRFQAFMLSALVTADLTNSKSWRQTERLSYPDGSDGETWCEGNAVVAPDGSIWDVLRLNNADRAGLIKLSDRGLKAGGVIDLPGGSKKFTIRYDQESRRYWSLTNEVTGQHASAGLKASLVRNTLSLMWSDDLKHWQTGRRILTDPDVAKHGFQYADWQFEGSDIVFVSRTAFDDDDGGAPRAHDANYLTFHRIENFRLAAH